MKIEVQELDEEFSTLSKFTDDPMTAEGLEQLSEAIIPLIQAGRLNNIIDLVSLISDQIEFVDSDTVEKMSHTLDEAVSAMWLARNSLRMASATMENKESTPSIFQLLKEFKDEDVRRSIDFIITTLKIMGKQIK